MSFARWLGSLPMQRVAFQLAQVGMKMIDDLTDNEWTLVEALFQMARVSNGRGGRPRVDARRILNGVLWALASGRGWATLPGRYPSPPTCRRRFEEWQADGTIAEVVKRLRASGREVSLRGPLGAATLQKPPAQTSQQGLRGVRWTTPESWHPPVATA
jgi:putative transposase